MQKSLDISRGSTDRPHNKVAGRVTGFKSLAFNGKKRLYDENSAPFPIFFFFGGGEEAASGYHNICIISLKDLVDLVRSDWNYRNVKLRRQLQIRAHIQGILDLRPLSSQNFCY